MGSAAEWQDSRAPAFQDSGYFMQTSSLLHVYMPSEKTKALVRSPYRYLDLT